jgi:hypothetical protein
MWPMYGTYIATLLGLALIDENHFPLAKTTSLIIGLQCNVLAGEIYSPFH